MGNKFFLPDSRLQSELARVLDETQVAFPLLAPNQIAVTWIHYEPPYRMNTGGALSAEEFWKYRPSGASYRGVELVEPASLVNVFYIVAAYVWLEQGMTAPSLETDRAIADTLVNDSNDAASYIVDLLSGTSSGPSLPAGPFETWKAQRNIVNRYFAQLDWPELRAANLNQKVWRDGPYGREQDFLGETFDNRNRLTTEAVARLLHSVVGGVSVSAARSQEIMKLLAHARTMPKASFDPATVAADSADQEFGFIGAGISPNAQIWSKSGSNSQVRYDAAYIESDSTHPYMLVVFIGGKEHSQNEAIIPFVSGRIFKIAQQIFQSEPQP